MEFLQQKIFIPPGIDHSHTVLMDETAVYLEDPRQVTVNEKGKHHVILKSTGFASMRVTVLLSVRPNGTKLTPVIIFKKAKETGLNVEQCEGCYVFYNEKAWVNQNLIKKLIDIVFPILSDRWQEMLDMGLLQGSYSTASEGAHDSLWNFECCNPRWLDILCASR
jgi:hypothetical protein